ncbi:hypothetical protein LINPERPRIM_LOCUS20353 [Linum perenne]
MSTATQTLQIEEAIQSQALLLHSQKPPFRHSHSPYRRSNDMGHCNGASAGPRAVRSDQWRGRSSDA